MLEDDSLQDKRKETEDKTMKVERENSVEKEIE